MYCEKCGYKLRRGVKSCAQCGAPTPYNRSRSVVLIIVAIFLSISVLVAVFILDHGEALPVIIVDILAVAAILTGLFVGIKRGCLYGTVSTVLLAAVFAISFLASQTVALPIYDSLIKEGISGSVNSAIEDSSPAQHIVDAVDRAVDRDDSLDIIIDFLDKDLTNSRKVTAARAYIQLTGIENTETNYVYSERYLSGELVGVDANGIEYDNRRSFAYILAESWIERCLPEYESLDSLYDTLTSLLNSSTNAYAEKRIASEIRVTIESDVLGILIGNDFFTPANVIKCIEVIAGEEAVSSSVDSIIWAYLTGNNVGKIVESRLFEPFIVTCLQIALFLILVLLLRFLMSLVMRIFRLLEGIHIPDALDIIFGTIEGIAGGAVWLCYAAVALEIAIIVILLFGGTFDTVINETIENTAVFRFFYQSAGIF